MGAKGRKGLWRDGSAVNAPAGLSEDLGSVPNTHIRQLTATHNPGSRNPIPLLVSPHTVTETKQVMSLGKGKK